ncbi:GroES-like protein [Laetiporus sulphureus 93-53]|uniref:GroES-like protein n=1 Tax=Laetiporus sulphureus 93-53 TaxID=1314785 RepID=A0A165HVV4_9APHY|nr:GroES-like protein [Laetiporus sulphureus 93-53]KZT12260.1 GroES-like protein [Laetiporus sulphureus 93-53]
MSTIHSAQVTSWGAPPTYTTIPAPPTPSENSEIVRIRVLATGVHQLVRSRAAGKHYTSGALPHTVGVDGVGTILPEGKTVYFITLRTGGGSFAELVNVPKPWVFDLPMGVKPEAIAAMVNPAMSSWMALKTRVDMQQLPKDGWTVLIVGATSTSGTIAAALARKLGAKRIIGVARNATKLSAVPNLDSTLALLEPIISTDFSQLGEVDVILDYLYGPIAAHLLSSLPRQRRPMQYVQIGTVAGPDIALPGAALRSKNLTIRGAGPGAWSFEELSRELPEMLTMLGEVEPPKIRIEKLSEIERVWGEKDMDGERLVFTP